MDYFCSSNKVDCLPKIHLWTFFLKKDTYMDLDAITNSEDGSNHFLCSFFYKK